MPSASSLNLHILREPAHCCLHDGRVILQANDLRRIPQHMHDMQLSRLAVSRVCGGSHLSRPSVYSPTYYSANPSEPLRCLQADLHQDVREGERQNACAPLPPVAVPHTWYHGPYDFGMHSEDSSPGVGTYTRHSGSPSPGTCQCDGLLYMACFTTQHLLQPSVYHMTPHLFRHGSRSWNTFRNS